MDDRRSTLCIEDSEEPPPCRSPMAARMAQRVRTSRVPRPLPPMPLAAASDFSAAYERALGAVVWLAAGTAMRKALWHRRPLNSAGGYIITAYHVVERQC